MTAVIAIINAGAIWARGSLANSTSLTEGRRFADQARIVFASFPEVTDVCRRRGGPTMEPMLAVSENTEFFVDLETKEKWRAVFHQDKNELIAAMNRKVSKLQGAVWNFSPPLKITSAKP